MALFKDERNWAFILMVPEMGNGRDVRNPREDAGGGGG